MHALSLKLWTCTGTAARSLNMQGSYRHPEAKGKGWVFKKKAQMRKKGYTNVPTDSKFTGRKRKDHW